MQSVDRAIRVLEILAAQEEIGVTRLAEELGVHKSTAFRLLAALEARGLVEQNVERGRYRLGFGILRLAGAITAQLDIVQQSRPVTTALAAEVGETINVTVLSGHDALYLDQVAPSSGIQLHNWVGQRIPLHATSNGKVLLAELPDAQVRELVGTPLPRFTDRTIHSLAALRRELGDVRSQGYASAVEELERGLVAVAAPIRGASGDVIASVSISGPAFRLPESRIDEVAALAVRAGQDISFRMGWHGIAREG
ncbi:MAG: IclR family transcriptional regulator [Actinomycetes bacterium]